MILNERVRQETRQVRDAMMQRLFQSQVPSAWRRDIHALWNKSVFSDLDNYVGRNGHEPKAWPG
jgi:hypothetical protein